VSPQPSGTVVRCGRATAQAACRAVFALACLAATAPPALAQRELRIRTLPETPLPFVTTCVAPLARWAAVNDSAAALAVSHRPGPASPAQLSVFKLDAQGQIAAGDPATIVFPKPASLADRPHSALGMVCHPRLPLLYVWQDVEPPPAPLTIDPALSADFDHLLIYDLSQTPPELVLATARGDSFHCGTAAGGLTLNADASRLFVPNMQQPGPMQKPVPAIGWIDLTPEGQPKFVEGSSPPELSKHLESTSYTLGDWPSPYSYALVSEDSVMLATYSGVASWNLADRLGRFGLFFLTPYIPYRYRIAAHPTAPRVYTAVVNYDGRMVEMEHAEGYLTLAPRTLWLDNVVMHSPPLYLPASNQLAVGAVGRIVLVNLDADGHFKAEGMQMTVNNPQVEALAWSARFGRLYVPVEKTP
jgi:hypothetical protein